MKCLIPNMGEGKSNSNNKHSAVLYHICMQLSYSGGI